MKKVRKSLLLSSCSLVFALTTAFPGGAGICIGSISAPGATWLHATGGWARGSSAQVGEDSPNPWNRRYPFAVPWKNIGRLASEEFLPDDLLGYPPLDSLLGQYGSENGRKSPGMPYLHRRDGPMDASGWNAEEETSTAHFENSNTEILWGYFYANRGKHGGQGVHASSTRFEANAPAGNALPAPLNDAVVPVPPSLPLLGSALIGLLILRGRVGSREQ